MHLTDTNVKRLAAPARGNKVTYDDAVKGFGCRTTAAGTRAFILNYRRKLDGKERRVTIGSFPDWTRWRRARRPSGSSARSTAAPIPSASSRRCAMPPRWPIFAIDS